MRVYADVAQFQDLAESTDKRPRKCDLVSTEEACCKSITPGWVIDRPFTAAAQYVTPPHSASSAGSHFEPFFHRNACVCVPTNISHYFPGSPGIATKRIGQHTYGRSRYRRPKDPTVQRGESVILTTLGWVIDTYPYSSAHNTLTGGSIGTTLGSENRMIVSTLDLFCRMHLISISRLFVSSLGMLCFPQGCVCARIPSLNGTFVRVIPATIIRHCSRPAIQ